MIRPERWQGLLDTLGLLEASLDELYSSRLDASVAALRAFVIGLRQQIQVVPQQPQQWASLIAALNQEAWSELSRLIVAIFESETAAPNAETLSDLRIMSERLHHHLTGMQRDMDLLLPWLLPISQPPALFVQGDVDSQMGSTWQDLLAGNRRFTAFDRSDSDLQADEHPCE